MNGVKQKRLVKSISKLAVRCCAYIGDKCDCKFMSDSTSESSIMTGSESGSGCPELMVAACLIAAMTEQEYNALTKRAGITISEDPAEQIDAWAIIMEEKQKRKDTFFASDKKKAKTSKIKSAYDLSTSKKAMKKMMPQISQRTPGWGVK